MVEKEKLTREEVLKQLDISNDMLSLYERELEITVNPNSPELAESFTREDLESIKVLHKLLESGMSSNEIRILASFSEILKNVDIEGSEGIKNLLALSPIYRLKQSLNITRQELDSLKSKAQELEDRLIREVEARAKVNKENISIQAELEAKTKTLENLDLKLAEALLQKAHLESQLSVNPEIKSPQIQIKGKKVKELHDALMQKENEILDLRKKSEELTIQLRKSKDEVEDLTERLELMESDASEMEDEVEERYQEQIKGIREQIEGLIDKKQQEWDSFHKKSSEQHKKELLTLQKRHEQEALKLKQTINEYLAEIEELKSSKNPIMNLFKKANAVQRNG